MSTATFKEVSPASQIYVAEQALSDDVCQNMIERFEQAKEEQYQGRIGQMENENLDIKRSTDLVISGKFHWHVDSGSHSFSDRQLVAIWYLNDVPGPGGETEFKHQDIKIRCEIHSDNLGVVCLVHQSFSADHQGNGNC